MNRILLSLIFSHVNVYLEDMKFNNKKKLFEYGE